LSRGKNLSKNKYFFANVQWFSHEEMEVLSRDIGLIKKS
jgi:hypothetical protein